MWHKPGEEIGNGIQSQDEELANMYNVLRGSLGTGVEEGNWAKMKLNY